MKFYELKGFFDKCLTQYEADVDGDQNAEVNAIIVFNIAKSGLTISHDESLHPDGENASDIALKRIGMMSSALWCGLQRDYGRPEPRIGLASLADLLGALGGGLGGESQEEGPQSDVAAAEGGLTQVPLE